jgi:tetratricopeptide (TPR) repeat protein
VEGCRQRWSTLLLITWLPFVGIASDAPVAVNLEAKDADTQQLLQSMLESAQANPASADARGQLGMAYERNGFGAAALSSFVQAETLDSGNFLWPYAHALLLGCNINSSPACAAASIDYPAALESIERAFAINDEYVPAWLWRASWLDELGRFEEAAIAYRRVMELGGEQAAAGVGMARVMLRLDRPSEAVALLEPLTADYAYGAIFRVLGRAYRALGRVEEARIAFARGRDETWLTWSDPLLTSRDQYFVSYGSRLARAESILDAGQAATALRELESLRSQQPNDTTLLRLVGTAYLRLGQSARARDVLRQGLKLKPDDYPLNLVMAGLYREAGLVDRALEHMQRAINAVPTRGGAHFLRGTILLEQKRYDEARTAFDTSLQNGVKNPEQVLYMAGTLEVLQQNWDAAASRFEQSVNLNAAFARGYLALAGSRAEQGSFDEARAALAWAAKVDADTRELAVAHRHMAALESAAKGAP